MTAGEFDILDMTKDLQKIAASVDGKAANDAVVYAAELFIGEARKRAPVEFGRLKNSEVVERPFLKTVKFGFNEPYSAIMDSGWRRKYIYPKRAKRLFVPISRRAKRYGTRSSSPRSLKYGKDYLLLKRVGPMPTAVKGRQTGPNKYFSGTIEDKREAAAKVIAERFDKEFARKTKS